MRMRFAYAYASISFFVLLAACEPKLPPVAGHPHDGGAGGGGAAGTGGSAGAPGGGGAGGAPGGIADLGTTGGSDGGGTCIIGQAGPLGLVPGATMAPGTACIACHVATNAGALHVAGTVYTAAHEADGCLGVTDVKVVVTDAQGAPHTLDVNSSGNFVDGTLLGFSTPMKVAVTRNGKTNPMVGTVTDGDCNKCHTAAGAESAPGRIMAP